jgi:lysosomal acid lipase/cholesteryl ester hydrolase
MISLAMNGDPSQWEAAMKMPHYNAVEMPVASLLEAHHILQWIRTQRFTMYDYGETRLNRKAYGQDKPPDIAAEYHRIDIPVDFAAGSQDMIIEADSVRQHYNHMLAAGLERLSWREFDFGHLDFTFSAQQDLKHFVVDRLERWQPPEGAPGRPLPRFS